MRRRLDRTNYEISDWTTLMDTRGITKTVSELSKVEIRSQNFGTACFGRPPEAIPSPNLGQKLKLKNFKNPFPKTPFFQEFFLHSLWLKLVVKVFFIDHVACWGLHRRILNKKLFGDGAVLCMSKRQDKTHWNSDKPVAESIKGWHEYCTYHCIGQNWILWLTCSCYFILQILQCYSPSMLSPFTVCFLLEASLHHGLQTAPGQAMVVAPYGLLIINTS